MAEWILIDERKPEGYGYYLAAWADGDSWKVSELWYNPNTQGSGWWPARNYMARFVGDVATNLPKRSLRVMAWMHMPQFPGPGRTIGYKAGNKLYRPEEVTIVREQFAAQPDLVDLYTDREL